MENLLALIVEEIIFVKVLNFDKDIVTESRNYHS